MKAAALIELLDLFTEITQDREKAKRIVTLVVDEASNVDTFPFFTSNGKWLYCYKDINYLNQHSQPFDTYHEALEDYSKLRMI